MGQLKFNISIVINLSFFQVCNKDVKHEYTAILNHLRVKHNMTLTQYTQTYIRGELAEPGEPGEPGDHDPVEITPELNIAEEEQEEQEEEAGMGEMGNIAEEMEMDDEEASEVADHQEEFYIVDPSNIN